MSYTVNKEDFCRLKKRNISADKNITAGDTEGLRFLILWFLAAEAIKTKTAYSEIKPNIKSLLQKYQ